MSHELRYLQDQPHEVFTNILLAAGFSAVVMLLVIAYLRWKHPKTPKEVAPRGSTYRTRRKRRRKH